MYPGSSSGRYYKSAVHWFDEGEISLQNVRAVCCSYNADMLPDLLVEKTRGSWTVYIANITSGFLPMDPLSRSPLAVPHSSAFINLLEQFTAGASYRLQLLFAGSENIVIFLKASKKNFFFDIYRAFAHTLLVLNCWYW